MGKIPLFLFSYAFKQFFYTADFFTKIWWKKNVREKREKQRKRKQNEEREKDKVLSEEGQR